MPKNAIDVAIGGKADMTIGTCPLSWSLSGVKQTWVGASHMSAYDPKRTLAASRLTLLLCAGLSQYDALSSSSGRQ